MNRRYSVLVIAMFAMLMGPSRGNGLADASRQPVVTLIQIFFKGHQAEQFIAGKKAKRYSLSIYGAGFDSSSTVVVNGEAVPSELVDTNQITARLSGIQLNPGVESLRVVNADGQASNFLTLDVVTDPSVLAVTSISKATGPIGTQVTLSGIGFGTSGNVVRLVRTSEPAHKGIAAQAESPNGRDLTFSIPSLLCPCVGCAAACIPTAAAEYRVFVTNENGTSTSAGFLVTPPGGPIGVWGYSPGFPPIKVTVTDSEISIEGGCFAGLSTTTLITDEAGNFSVAGFYASLAGPVRLTPALRPAKFSGSINGNTMTLTFTVDGISMPIGPFTLTFGNDVKIANPCV
jgi:hypothetical protein